MSLLLGSVHVFIWYIDLPRTGKWPDSAPSPFLQVSYILVPVIKGLVASYEFIPHLIHVRVNVGLDAGKLGLLIGRKVKRRPDLVLRDDVRLGFLRSLRKSAGLPLP